MSKADERSQVLGEIGEILPDLTDEDLKELHRNLSLRPTSKEPVSDPPSRRVPWGGTGEPMPRLGPPFMRKTYPLGRGSTRKRLLARLNAPDDANSANLVLDKQEREVENKSWMKESQDLLRPEEELSDIEAQASALLERVEKLNGQGIPILIQLFRGALERILIGYDEEKLMEELADRGIPKWLERHELPADEQTDDLDEWMSRYYSDYLSYYGAPVDRLFQFQLQRYDKGLLAALRNGVKRKNVSVTTLDELVGTKSDYQNSLKGIFPSSAWALFMRIWANEHRAVARRRAVPQ